MKAKKFLTILGLTVTLATAQIVDLPNQKPKEAQAQSNRSYIVLDEKDSEIRINCESHEVTCDGYNPIPVFLGDLNGIKAKRFAHNDIPSDEYLQRQMADRINNVLASSLSSDANRYEVGVLHPNRKAYFFAGDKYYRFDFESDQVDRIGTIGVDGWKGLPTNIGAAVLHPNGKAYFFVGDKYYRFDFQSDQVDKIGTIGIDGWKGLPKYLDLAIEHPNGQAYFFIGKTYYRYNYQTDQVDKIGKVGVDGWKGL